VVLVLEPGSIILTVLLDLAKPSRLMLPLSESFLRMVDDWRRGQSDLPSRTEAIRRLVELGTKSKNKQ
jgi:hypothetical protein